MTYAADPYDCADGADALVIVTEWDAFRALDFERVKRVMNDPVLVDLRNIYRPELVRKLGFRYVSVGQPAAGEPEPQAEILGPIGGARALTGVAYAPAPATCRPSASADELTVPLCTSHSRPRR